MQINFVSFNDKKKQIILARDHGGPWQNNLELEKKFNEKQAMESAKRSYKEDIDNDFKVLHIDPSIDISGNVTKSKTLDRLFELYEYCCTYAENKKKEIIFEIGTEEQSGSTNSQEELEETLAKVNKFCKTNKFPEPTFVVIQTGTRVMETRNVGSFDFPLRINDEIPPEIQVPKMIEICNENNILMKEHNTDYLSDVALSWHPRLGIHSANVAPEFGVTETLAILKIMEEHKFNTLRDKFLELSFNSKKWKKWMLPNTNTTDKDKSVIAGHYIFSKIEFREIKEDLSKKLSPKGVDLDKYLCDQIEKSIERYLFNFRLVRN